ncbi:MAG: hypothetical protein ACREQK_19115 [Candidatus Binatia bacterium]
MIEHLSERSRSPAEIRTGAGFGSDGVFIKIDPGPLVVGAFLHLYLRGFTDRARLTLTARLSASTVVNESAIACQRRSLTRITFIQLAVVVNPINLRPSSAETNKMKGNVQVLSFYVDNMALPGIVGNYILQKMSGIVRFRRDMRDSERIGFDPFRVAGRQSGGFDHGHQRCGVLEGLAGRIPKNRFQWALLPIAALRNAVQGKGSGEASS